MESFANDSLGLNYLSFWFNSVGGVLLEDK
jgi:hypothetical protein